MEPAFDTKEKWAALPNVARESVYATLCDDLDVIYKNIEERATSAMRLPEIIERKTNQAKAYLEALNYLEDTPNTWAAVNPTDKEWVIYALLSQAQIDQDTSEAAKVDGVPLVAERFREHAEAGLLAARVLGYQGTAFDFV